jgi:hypothetical protein
LESLSFSLLAVHVRVLIILKSRVVSQEGHISIYVLWRLKELSNVIEVNLVCVIMLIVINIFFAKISLKVIGGHGHSRIVLVWFHFNFSSSIIKGTDVSDFTNL